jgi:hypothetical protein
LYIEKVNPKTSQRAKVLRRTEWVSQRVLLSATGRRGELRKIIEKKNKLEFGKELLEELLRTGRERKVSVFEEWESLPDEYAEVYVLDAIIVEKEE